MKRIYMTLALAAAFGVTSFAQKTADLQLTSILYPPVGTQMPNVNIGDTVLFAVTITNLGPDAVVSGDSVKLAISGNGVATDGTTAYSLVSTYYDLPLAANQTDTLVMRLIQGQSYGGGVMTQLPSNTIDTFHLFVMGVDASGVAFTDPGYDPSQPSGEKLDPDGNNIQSIAITFGDPNGITDLFKTDNKSLAVYPNPVSNGNLQFSYDFAGTTTAMARVTDITGRVVLTQNFGKVSGSQNFSLDVSKLTAGTYMIELNSDNGRAVSKFTVQK